MKAKTIIPPSSIEEIQQLKQLIRVQTRNIENLSSSLWHSIIADEPPAKKSDYIIKMVKRCFMAYDLYMMINKVIREIRDPLNLH
jgi:hypothetical protein